MHVLRHEGGWFEIWSEKQMFRSHYKDSPHFFQIIWSIFERMAAVFVRAPIAIKLVQKTTKKHMDVIYSHTKFEPNRTMNKCVAAILVNNHFIN